jgi:hypothetical protein
MRRLLTAVMLLALSACAPNKHDSETCQSYGLPFGGPEYGKCMRKLAEQRNESPDSAKPCSQNFLSTSLYTRCQ